MWYWTIALGEIRQRPSRALLTLLSVLIGVAAVVSVWLAVMTTRAGYRRMYEVVGGQAALEVVAEAGDSFDDEIVAHLAQAPGVRAAVPVMQRAAIVYAGEHRVRVLALGIDPQRDHLVREYALGEGRRLTSGRQVLLESGFARSVGVGVGDQLKLLTRLGVKRFEVVGILEPRGVAGFRGGSILFLPLDEAQRLFRSPGKVDTVSVVLEEGRTAEELQESLTKYLPPGLVARPPAARTEIGRETMVALEGGMALSSAMSLVAAAVIILNCFFMNLTERWRQLAVLRALGTTRRQLLGLVVREGLLLGIIGTALGILAGLAGAFLLIRGMERLLQVELPALQLGFQPILMGTLLGIGISLAGVSIPAWFASRITPLEGMRETASGDREAAHPWLTGLGVLLLAAAAAPTLLISLGWLTPKAAIWPIMGSLTGLVLLLPAASGPLVRGMSPAVQLVAGLVGRLASRQVLRRRLRTSLTAGVLFVVMAMNVAIGNAVLDNMADIGQWYRQTIVGDFFVRAMMPDMTTGTAATMPEELSRRLETISGVSRVEKVRFVSAEVAGSPVIVVARTIAQQTAPSLDLIEGEPAATLDRLRKGDAVISSVLAQRTGLGIGDRVRLSTPEGTHRLTIAGITNEYTAGGLVVVLEFDVAKQLLGVQGADVFIVKVAPGRQAELEAALQTIATEHGLILQSYAELTRLVDSMIAGVVGGLWVLMGLGFIVASFAVANTLTMNVLEQTRELGLLRLVAMTRRQVRRFVLFQGLVIAAVGLVPGTLVGVLTAYGVNRLTHPVSGHPVEFVFRPAVVFGCLAVSFVIVLVAAYLPARRASRLSLVEAIQYE
jgi:putative ABC transport system permease protein